MEMEPLYLTIINHLRDGVYFVNEERRIVFWNKAAEEITGYTAEEIVGKSCQNTHLKHIDEEGKPLCTVACPLFATIVDGTQREGQVLVRHKQGHRIPISISAFPVEENGKIVGAVEIFTQNSTKVYDDDMVEHLSDIAMHDALTGLPNRRYLESFLRYKFDEYKQFRKKFAVLFADIDDFSSFNNQHGHDVGDAVLKSVAKSVVQSMRKDDLMGRWGGEEMVGIYAIIHETDVPIIAEKFRNLVANTEILHNGKWLSVSVSIGVTIAKSDDTPESILERADHLMYLSKRAGKDRVTVG